MSGLCSASMIGFDSTNFPDGEASEADMGRDGTLDEEKKTRTKSANRHAGATHPEVSRPLAFNLNESRNYKYTQV